jgi:hypothetical protein
MSIGRIFLWALTFGWAILALESIIFDVGDVAEYHAAEMAAIFLVGTILFERINKGPRS